MTTLYRAAEHAADQLPHWSIFTNWRLARSPSGVFLARSFALSRALELAIDFQFTCVCIRIHLHTRTVLRVCHSTHFGQRLDIKAGIYLGKTTADREQQQGEAQIRGDRDRDRIDREALWEMMRKTSEREKSKKTSQDRQTDIYRHKHLRIDGGS